MLRTVKYLSLLVVQFIGALLGVGALFIAFYAVSTPLSEFESAGWRILGMAFACGMMFPFVLQASGAGIDVQQSQRAVVFYLQYV